MSRDEGRRSEGLGSSFGLARLYAIADVDTWGEDQIVSLVERWQLWGVRCIQLRAKRLPSTRVQALAHRCMDRLDGETHFWINDHPEVARAVGAAGVHLGQDDLEAAVARDLLAQGQWIGRSTHDLEEALTAEADSDVDIVAVGPIFETGSKTDPEPTVGLRLLSEICARVTKPVVAIGGITPDSAATVIRSGAASVAMIGALRGPDPERTTRGLLDSLSSIP